MIYALVVVFIVFAAVSYLLPDPQVKKLCLVGMVICVIAFALIVVLHFAGLAPATWPYGVARP